MFHDFSFNGFKLSELGAVIRQRPTHIISLPSLNFVEKPYKSGDEIINYGRYSNLSYKIPIRAMPAFCDLTLEEFARKLAEWLVTEEYGIFRDTYNNGYFRYGIVTEISDIIGVESDVYETEITFNFQPFLYSDEGQNLLTYSSTNNSISATIINPENVASEPVIKIIGSGNFTLTINGKNIYLTNAENFIIIDKPKEDVYDNNGSCNGKINAVELPIFKTGTNTIAVTGNNAFTLEITPNWRRL